MKIGRVTHRLAIAMAIASLTAVSVAAQSQASGSRLQGPGSSPEARTPRPGARKNYTPAKTPWGDPDLTGVYTNKDESGIPIERPAQFGGKTLDDVDDSEFAEIVKQRNDAARARAPLAGGAETGAGPIHWFENDDAKNSRAWLLTEPADGRIPPTTPEAQKRAADRAAAAAARRAGRGPADW
jgi:hypothetical protein